MGTMVATQEYLNNVNSKPKKAPKNNYRSIGRQVFNAIKSRSKSDISCIKKADDISVDLINKIYKEFFPPPKKRAEGPYYFTKHPEDLFRNEDKLAEIEDNAQITPEKYTNSNTSDLLNNSKISDRADIAEELTSRDIDNLNISMNIRTDFELKYTKTGDDLRKSYIAKLIWKKVWLPTVKEKNHNCLIIFDWDDTLLCTTFLLPNGIFVENMKIEERAQEKIQSLDTLVSALIKMAISKGDTYIITNGAPGWVEYSAKRFYPEVFKELGKVKIVSARGVYERNYPGDCRQWKIMAFLELLNNINVHLVTNLICLGDSIIEMEAVHILASQCNQAFIKTIKFKDAPKPEELYKQIKLLLDQFESIISSVKNLTIRVEKKGQAPKNNNLTK